DLIYLVHDISVNSSGTAVTSGSLTTDAVHVVVLSALQNAVLTQATYYNSSYDYIFPSIAANASGNIIIGFTRSSATQGSGPTNGNLGAYAVEAKIDPNNPAAGITFGSDI